MNYRVHLQYEFTQLGLDNYLEKLRYTESEELQAHNRLAQMERDSAAQITNLERLLVETRNERDKLREGRRQAEEEAETLRRESAHYRASLDEKNMAGFPRESSRFQRRVLMFFEWDRIDWWRRDASTTSSPAAPTVGRCTAATPPPDFTADVAPANGRGAAPASATRPHAVPYRCHDNQKTDTNQKSLAYA
ncbi:unnamed protein product [Nesidiocoris tenuis]|uniref:Formin FH3 domain-containing protein n=1 Tax=Nesidiocoris tenuis TaxID=355587 RepID=A0A6H5H496_9HEMI|nr:unnamed protein product [Nesidiocoris tenuis]